MDTYAMPGIYLSDARPPPYKAKPATGRRRAHTARSRSKTRTKGRSSSSRLSRRSSSTSLGRAAPPTLPTHVNPAAPPGSANIATPSSSSTPPATPATAHHHDKPLPAFPFLSSTTDTAVAAAPEFPSPSTAASPTATDLHYTVGSATASSPAPTGVTTSVFRATGRRRTSSPSSSRLVLTPNDKHLPPVPRRALPPHHAAMGSDPSQTNSASISDPAGRNGSISSATSHSNRPGIMTLSEALPHSSTEGSVSASVSTASGSKVRPAAGPKPLIMRNGRTYIHDEQLPYPLPVDLAELHRQSLRTLLLFQLFGGPIVSTAFDHKPPLRILEVGCGSGFWSMMCHRYFAQKHGHSAISFTGMDIVPLCGTGPDPNSKPDKDMDWRFVQHDMRRAPWPFQDGEFDLVMVKDMAHTAPGQFFQVFTDEYLRILKPGGVLELWETDSTIRMLRPHVPATSSGAANEDSESDTDDEEDNATRLGAYIVTANTPLSAPLNPFLVEYNGWLSKALDRRYLSAVPCTMIGPSLLQEDGLVDVRSKRLAIPLSEVRWEREGVGGVVTKDGKSYIDSMKGKGKASDSKAAKVGKALTPAQSAIRRTALETSVGLIQALEPMLRDVSGKSQDEWDGWTGKMMNDLLRDGGTSWGECLEVGVWTARKKN